MIVPIYFYGVAHAYLAPAIGASNMLAVKKARGHLENCCVVLEKCVSSQAVSNWLEVVWTCFVNSWLEGLLQVLGDEMHMRRPANKIWCWISVQRLSVLDTWVRCLKLASHLEPVPYLHFNLQKQSLQQSCFIPRAWTNTMRERSSNWWQTQSSSPTQRKASFLPQR